MLEVFDNNFVELDSIGGAKLLINIKMIRLIAIYGIGEDFCKEPYKVPTLVINICDEEKSNFIVRYTTEEEINEDYTKLKSMLVYDEGVVVTKKVIQENKFANLLRKYLYNWNLEKYPLKVKSKISGCDINNILNGITGVDVACDVEYVTEAVINILDSYVETGYISFDTETDIEKYITNWINEIIHDVLEGRV